MAFIFSISASLTDRNLRIGMPNSSFYAATKAAHFRSARLYRVPDQPATEGFASSAAMGSAAILG